MDDLIKRMGRQLHSWELDEPFDDWWTYQKDFRNARDRIEAQEAEIARLREALGASADAIERGDLYERMCCNGRECGCQGSSNADYVVHCIRQALQETANEPA